MSEIKAGVLGIVGFIVLILVLSSVKFIGVGQRAVVFNKFNGKVERTLEQGMNIINPIVSKIKKYNIQTTAQGYEMDGLSSDSQTIHCQLVVNYRLQTGRLIDIYQNVQGNVADTILQNAVIDTTKAELGKFTIDNIAKNRETLKLAVENALKKRMGSQGIDIQNVSITNIDFSKEFEASIQNKMIAEQNALEAKNLKEKVRYESEAKAIENEKIAATISPMVLRAKWIEKWNGALPNVMTAENASMLLQMKD